MLLLDRVSGEWEDKQFRDLPKLLRGDELVIVNNVKVMPARLFGRRAGIHSETPGRSNSSRNEFLQAPIEVLLVRQIGADTWETLVRPGRKVPAGERIIFGDGELHALVEGRGEYGLRVLRFTSTSGFHETLGRLGHIPLPPYIKRADEPFDRDRYPTAGLHFTPEIIAELRGRGVEIAEITLEVGLGTFEPVRTEKIEDHAIHAEAYEIPVETASALGRAKREKRPVLAVGTTVVRALEDAAGKSMGREEPVAAGKAEAAILLYPGKAFRVVNQLLTNFHLPRSSLLALVAAFAGRENILRAYRHAVESGFRFYSYGDSMLIR
jgi:S-adenosylmethionine:tRNA ribosyltransferase-isomerase